jgi:hypothetical protein
MHVWRNPVQLSIVFVLIMDAALFPRSCYLLLIPGQASGGLSRQDAERAHRE